LFVVIRHQARFGVSSLKACYRYSDGVVKEIRMSKHPLSTSRFPVFQRLWKPALVAGAGGTTLFIWFEEIMVFVAEFIGVILLAILGGLVCLFDHFVFKSRMPRRENKQDTTTYKR
jgi:hypothetical protein